MSEIAVSNEVEMRFRNFYKCPNDGEEWQDVWDSTCNDHCPKCHAEIEPYKSEDLTSTKVDGIGAKQVGPFMGVQFDEKVSFKTRKDGGTYERNFRIITYQAYNAFGLIGPEYNGVSAHRYEHRRACVAVLDEDQKKVLCDEIEKESTGYFGVSEAQTKKAEWLSGVKWGEFRRFINNHPRKRYDI